MRAFFYSRYPFAIGAGLLLAIAFPTVAPGSPNQGHGIAGFAWIAPGFMALIAIGKPAKSAWRIGYVAGLAHYLASLYWLLLIPVAWYPILGWAALSAFMAIYPAFWVMLLWKFFPAKLTGEAPATKLQNWSAQFLQVSWSQRTLWTLGGAAWWVALEMFISRFLGGFPWNLLGSSQYRITPLLHLAATTGIYGVSFLLVWTALSLVCAGMVIVGKPARRSAWIGEIILPLLAVAMIYGIGYEKLLRADSPSREITVALIQPSIPQSMIWDDREDSNRFQQLLQLSYEALAKKPDVILWPEAALPGMLRYQEELLGPVTGLARSNQVWMITGSDDKEPAPHGSLEQVFFNASFLINPQGDLVERYCKRNLVIFGEYIPLYHWLPFIKYFTPIQGGFTAGSRVVPFHLRNLGVQVSVMICFEDVFPHLVREYVDDQTDFLINLTNDGWFGEGAAQWQQGAAAVFRAVENGVPLVQCSNNGLTGWIDAQGRIRDTFETGSHSIYGQGYLVAHVPILSPGTIRVPTYYRRHGDVFGWICVSWSLSQWVWIAIGGRMNKTKFQP